MSNLKEGQVLLIVFLVLLILTIIGGGLVFLWQSDTQVRFLQKESAKAFYLAQAGSEHGKVWARNNPTASLTYASGDITFGAGVYSFTVSDFGCTSKTKKGVTVTVCKRRITSIGRIGPASSPIAERRISVDIDGIENPMDTSNDVVVDWTWHEV